MTLVKSDGTTKLQSFDYYYGFSSTDARQADYANGFVKSVTDLDGSKVTYGYDALDRLKDATRSGMYSFTQSYTYDDNNNRLTLTKNGTTTSASYDAANQMTAFGGTSYSYDRNGNLTAFGSNSLNYDESNKWVSGTVNGNDVTFGYDGFGRRSSRTVGTGRIDYWYDVTGLTLQTGATNATFLRDQSGSVRSITSGGATHNYGKDRLGSVTAMVATDGTVARTYSYDPWGETIGITGTAYNPFLFTGTYKDGATGLYQMGARYYQSASGRFTQQDPLPDSILSFNRYAYANCNPANGIDPTGLLTAECQAAVVDLIGLFAGTVAGGLGKYLVEALISQFFSVLSVAVAGAQNQGSDPLGAALNLLNVLVSPLTLIPGIGQGVTLVVGLVSSGYSLGLCVASL